MKTKETVLNSSVLAATSLSVLVLAALLAIVLSGHGDLSWNTRPFANDHGLGSCIFLILAVFAFFRGYRNPEWDAFSPLRLFFTIWFVVLAVGCLRLTTAEPAFTVRFWVTVTCGLLGFYLGAQWASRDTGKGERIALGKLRHHLEVNWQPSRALLVMGCGFAICLLAYAYEYWRAGMLPLLAEDPEWARFNFGVNSYVHRFAISFYLLIFLGFAAVVYLRKYRAPFSIIAILSFAAISLLTMRVYLLSAVWMAIVLFHYGRRRMTPRVALLVVLIAYPLAKVAVDVKRFYENTSFSHMLDEINFPEKGRLFAPDYLYFSMTMQTMDNLTHLVPDEVSYSYGWYIGYPVRVFWTPRQGEGFRGRLDDLFWERSAEWSPVPSVTTSYMGVPYADFGIPGVFLFSCFFGWLSARVYEALRRQPSFWMAFLYSQITFAIMLSIYANYLTLFDLYWNLAVIGLVHHLVSNRSKLVNQGVAGQLVLSS
jgi:oligosaccharide repeat unit polymerase